MFFKKEKNNGQNAKCTQYFYRTLVRHSSLQNKTYLFPSRNAKEIYSFLSATIVQIAPTRSIIPKIISIG
jgi:hypothetical protein